jgi:hypothetical protein
VQEIYRTLKHKLGPTAPARAFRACGSLPFRTFRLPRPFPASAQDELCECYHLGLSGACELSRFRVARAWAWLQFRSFALPASFPASARYGPWHCYHLALALPPNRARFSAVSTFGSLPFWALRLPRSSPASARYELWDCSRVFDLRDIPPNFFPHSSVGRSQAQRKAPNQGVEPTRPNTVGVI